MSTPKTYDQYVKLFISGVMDTINIDYGDKASVRKNNRGVDRYRKAAKDIGTFYPDRIEEFSELLLHDEAKIRICCAVCLVELMGCSADIKNQAVDHIKQHRKTCDGTAEAMGWDWWLKEYS